jgi:hypothetical protein
MKTNKYLLIFLLFCTISISMAQAQVIAVQESSDLISQRLQYEIDKTKDPNLGYVPKNELIKAFNEREQIIATQKQTRAQLVWTERGPDRDSTGPTNGNSRINGDYTSARVRAVWEDLNDVNQKKIWIGAADGGLWYTNDITLRPSNWIKVNDFFANLAISAICQNPKNKQIMYFGTGEKTLNSDAVRGGGIWQSINGGVSWSVMPNTENIYNIAAMQCDSAGNLYVGTTNGSSTTWRGLLRYTTSTATWTNVTPVGYVASVSDLEYSSNYKLHVTFGYQTGPTGATYAFTTSPSTITSSVGWTIPTGVPFANGYNADIESKGDTLYILANTSTNNISTIYRSYNGGTTWSTTLTTPAFTSGQGWYCLGLGLAINPLDAKQVMIGSLDCFKSINVGDAWTKVSTWVGNSAPSYVHSDIHVITWNKFGRVIIASDGGIFYSADNGATIRDRNQNLRIKQFYSVAIHPTSANYFLAGAQDNGVHQFKNAGLSGTAEVTGGDGCYVHIDQNEPQYQYGSYVYNNYYRSINAGGTWANVPLSTTIGKFINPTDYDDVANTMYCGSDVNQFIRWDNAPTATTYSNVALPALNGNSITAVKVSPFTANQVYFGTSGTAPVLVKVTSAKSATPIGTAISKPAMQVAGGVISNIEFGTNEQNIIITYSNYGVNNIWVTADGGANWTAIDGNLPNMPVRWAMFYPGSNTRAIIATEIGVWQTDLINGASTLWAAETTFPNVRTDMLQYRAADNLLAAASHGRGLWTATFGTGGAGLNTCASAYEPNESNATATTIAAAVTYTAAIATVCDNDFYKIITTSNNNIKVNLVGPTGVNFEVYVYDVAGTQIGAGISASSVDSVLLASKPAGTYFVRVIGAANAISNNCYTLKTTLIPVACQSTLDNTSNNSIAGAAAIPLNTAVNGLITPSGDIDIYKCTITTGGTMTFTLSGLTADYGMNILNNAGGILATSNNPGTANESISGTLTEGVFYIQITGTAGANSSSVCYQIIAQKGTAVIAPMEYGFTQDDKKEISVKVFPNPTTSKVMIYIVGDITPKQLIITDLTGRTVYNSPISQMENHLDISALAKGTYLVFVKDANGNKLFNDKLIKE